MVVMGERCSYCQGPIPKGAHPYTLRLELFPAIEPSLQWSERDLETDFAAEMKRLIDAMEKMGDREVFEQEKLMFLSHSFTLCPKCRNEIAQRLEHLLPPPQG